MRIARHIQPSGFYHLISRFAGRAWLVRDDIDRAEYLRRLGLALGATDWRCLAYAVMSNHVHLAVVAGTTPIGSLLKRAHAPFAHWLNARHGRLGPVFAERAAAWAVRPLHVGRLIAYIHTNPVRAGVVPRAGDSPWTSHAAYIGRAAQPPWLDVDAGIRHSGVRTEDFDDWVGERAGTTSELSLADARRAAHRFGALELGTPTLAPVEVPLVVRSHARVRPSPAAVVSAVAEAMQVPATAFCSRSRGPGAVWVLARRLALGIGERAGLSIAEMSAALGITRQAGARLVARAWERDTRVFAPAVESRLTTVTPSPD